MMVIMYDNNFNKNEWFIIISLVVEIILVMILPRRFSLLTTIVFCLYGFFLGLTVDHHISIVPFDYYDVNDKSAYQLLDFATYMLYGPFLYFYMYLYDYFKFRTRYATLYILLWAMVSLALEYLSVTLGVFHYKNGYELAYSFPIYLLIFSSAFGLYIWVKD